MRGTTKVKTWNKTKIQGLVRHKSGTYYARLFIGGKEKWRSLKTTLLEIAKARMQTDETVTAIRVAQANKEEAKSGKLSVSASVQLYRDALALRIEIKDSTRKFWLWNLKSLLESWPGLEAMEVGKVTESHCLAWASETSKTMSVTYFNNSVISLERIFEAAIEAGALYRNPASAIERKRAPEKILILPSRQQFADFVKAIRNAKHQTSLDAADLVELLAYTGCRISEAQELIWQDANFEDGVLTVKGDKETGTKNWGIRRIPMIPECRELLEHIQKRRDTEPSTVKIARVGDARGSMEKAALAVGMAEITHHDLRHFFATICIESGVDIPTVSRWLGHKDGGALAMKVYGHLRDEHSKLAAQKVSFSVPQN
jgi:integrase